MRAEEHVRVTLHEKRVLHVPRGVLWGKIQPSEDVPVVLNFRTFRHGKPHVFKDADDFATHHLQRVMGPSWHASRRLGQILA